MESQIRFQINLNAARQSRLEVSSKLLKSTSNSSALCSNVGCPDDPMAR
ncbi:MAG: YfiR family protein [Syntrophobacteraceae bacterium]|nr:YfiR family protein [Syntrophobacteraceae bacterium]